MAHPTRAVATARAFAAVLATCLAASVVAPHAVTAQQPKVFTFDDPSYQAGSFAAIRNGTLIGDIRFDPASAWSTGNGNFGVRYTGQFNCHSAPYCSSPNGYDAGRDLSYGQFSFATPQRFFGAWVSGPADVNFGTVGAPFQQSRVFWELLLNGQVVYTSSMLDVVPTPQFFAVGYTGLVDAVRLAGGAGGTVVDDITYGVAAVPEPATLALVGAGLASATLAARRRRTRPS